MITPVYRGENLRRLLGYLYGPGRCEDHHDPHLIAAWDPHVLATMDPGRIDGATLTDLARLLDAPIKAHPQPDRLGRYVWHCAARTAPDDRTLTDLDWSQIAQRLLHAAGIAPTGDDAACRWVAVRHADNHIHIAATLLRQDGRRPRHHNDFLKLRREAIQLEAELGLRTTAPADHTARKRPTRQEIARAERLGLAEPARDTLTRTVRHAAIASATEIEFFLRLSTAGLHVYQRTGPDGSITGYAVALPGHRSATGQLIWYAGSRLAPDLSLPKIRKRLAGKDTGLSSFGPSGAAARRVNAWRHAERRVHTAGTALAGAGDSDGAAVIAGLGDLLTAAARQGPDRLRDQLTTAAATYDRAAHTTYQAQDGPASIQLRRAARALVGAGRAASTGHELEAAIALVLALTLAVRTAATWHTQRHHQVQAEAARSAAARLDRLVQAPPQADRERTRADTGRSQELDRRLPRTAYADVVRAALQGHEQLADRVLGDPAWPTLQRSIHELAMTGANASHALARGAVPRELGSARSAARVLSWRLRQQLGKADVRRKPKAEQLQML